MLEDGHAQTLQSAGLDYYNNHLDSAPDFYGDVTTTRDNQDRLDTLVRVRSAGVKVEGTPPLCLAYAAHRKSLSQIALFSREPDRESIAAGKARVFPLIEG